MSTLRNQVTKLAQDNPTLRPHLVPLLKEAGVPESILSPGTPSEHPEVKAFLQKMEATFRRYFPKGHYGARASTKFGHNSIYIAAHILPKGQQPNGILRNDPSRNTFWMHDSYDENGMKPKIKIEMSEGNALYGPNASNKEKVGWRNGTGKPEGAVRKFDKYFGKLRSMVNARDDVQV